MFRDNKYPMLETRQVSFLDHPDLIGSADLGIRVSPEEIAERFSLTTERSFDDLGDFEFLAVAFNKGIIAFRRYSAKSDQYSYISYKNFDREEAREIVRSLLADPELEVLEFDDKW